MMFSKTLIALAVSLILPAQQVLGVYVDPPTTKAISQCHNVTLTLKGLPPFIVTVWPGCSDDPDTTSALSAFQTNASSATWVIREKAGKSIQFGIEDAHQNFFYTDDYTVQDSGIEGCLDDKDSWRTTTNTTSSDPSNSSPVANPGDGKLQATTTYGSAAESQSAVVGGNASNGALSTFAPRTEAAAVAAAFVLAAFTLF